MYYHGTAADLLRMPHYHPTLAEIVTYPAESIVERLSVREKRFFLHPARGCKTLADFTNHLLNR
jgi:hypothetical protein